MGDRTADTPVALRYGMFPLLVLGSGVAVEQGERLSLAQALDGIRDDFGASDTVLGALSAAMVLIGVVGAFPMGILADRWRRGALLGIAMVIWTLCMGFNALAPTLLLLFVARLGVGAVEANSPASYSLLADYYPVASRARMMGRYQVCGAMGGLVALAVAGPLVDNFGWRWAFWMWVPLGAVSAVLLFRLPEPARGAQDRAFHLEERERIDVDTEPGLLPDYGLPPPRVGTLDYGAASWREVMHELVQIRSMWFGLMALTISSFLLNGLLAWGIEFFKREHALSATEAGAYSPIIGAGAALGLVGGGVLSDRLLKAGDLNARVHVAAVSSVLATVLLLPAVLAGNLLVSAIFFFFGSVCLTAPVAPSEALVSDVVPGALRGRAASVRSVVRALAALAPVLVGAISDAFDEDLRIALAAVTPLYAIGGLVMLLAARTYPADLAYAAAEAERTSVRA